MKSTRFNYFQYLLVIFAVLIITFLKMNVSLFAEGLTGIFYLLLVAMVALYGDYLVGVFSIILSCFALYFVLLPQGFGYNRTVMFQTIEYLFTSIVIFLLTWRMRSLRKENTSLLAAANDLKGVIKTLKKDSKDKKKDLAKLNSVNKDLNNVVNQFLEDEGYWRNQIFKIRSKSGNKD